MCVIFFSDMDLFSSDWQTIKKYAPERVMFVTGETTANNLDGVKEWIDRSPKREILLINLK